MPIRMSAMRFERTIVGRAGGAVIGVSVVAVFASSLIVLTQRASPSGEELYVDRLGCWNCHGTAGGGGAGRAIAKTTLPLRKFVKYVRLPSETMPPFAPVLASDRDLMILYRWLDGAEATHTPPSILLSLRSSGSVREDGQNRADTLIEVTARSAEPSSASAPPAAASLRYRVVLAQAGGPLAHRTIQCSRVEGEEWLTLTTDEHGEALLSPEQGFVLADAVPSEKQASPARLRMALSAGRYALLIEALDQTDPARPMVAGIGTTIFNVE